MEVAQPTSALPHHLRQTQPPAPHQWTLGVARPPIPSQPPKPRPTIEELKKRSPVLMGLILDEDEPIKTEKKVRRTSKRRPKTSSQLAETKKPKSKALLSLLKPKMEPNTIGIEEHKFNSNSRTSRYNHPLPIKTEVDFRMPFEHRQLQTPSQEVRSVEEYGEWTKKFEQCRKMEYSDHPPRSMPRAQQSDIGGYYGQFAPRPGPGPKPQEGQFGVPNSMDYFYNGHNWVDLNQFGAYCMPGELVYGEDPSMDIFDVRF